MRKVVKNADNTYSIIIYGFNYGGYSSAIAAADDVFTFSTGCYDWDKHCADECETCLFSLVFGNEASGLDKNFMNIGMPVKIPLSSDVDSFNLGVAAGIGMYIFAKKNKRI